ncbi:MAG: hypothetical protein CSA79_00410 [Thiothrix nivea]|nr:MAG: hypothetical protein CSA79_00410 [Thiothrix nivea]
MNKLNVFFKILLFFFVTDLSFASGNSYRAYIFNDDTMKRQQASKGVVSAVVDYERHKPSPNTLSSDRLSNCKLEARPFELGDGSLTNEWLISTPPECSVHGIATHWIIRNINGKLYVLVSSRGKGVSVYDLEDDSNLSSGGVEIMFSMHAPLPDDISSEVIKKTKMKCLHFLSWPIPKKPAPLLNNDIATVSVVDVSIDPSIHG